MVKGSISPSGITCQHRRSLQVGRAEPRIVLLAHVKSGDTLGVAVKCGEIRILAHQCRHGVIRLRYLGRERNASPAEGSSARHAQNQRALVAAAFAFTQRVTV